MKIQRHHSARLINSSVSSFQKKKNEISKSFKTYPGTYYLNRQTIDFKSQETE